MQEVRTAELEVMAKVSRASWRGDSPGHRLLSQQGLRIQSSGLHRSWRGGVPPSSVTH